MNLREFEPGSIKLIAGLGNLGKDYSNTYHNAGLLFIDELISLNYPEERIEWKSRQTFSYAKTDFFILLKPDVYMNESGLAIYQALSFFKIPTEEMAVAHDDADIPLGQYRISFGQGHAGHNGVRSIKEQLGTTDFWRVRIGISRFNEEGKKTKPAGDFVLSQISKTDKNLLGSALKTASAEFKKDNPRKQPVL